MPQLLVRHKIADYAKWKPVFDGHASMQKAAGITSGRLFHSADDASEIVILFEVQDIERAREFTQSEDLKKAMEQSGVVDMPDIYLLEEISEFKV